MNTPDWDKIKSIFASAIDLVPAERAAFLTASCEGDEMLFAEVVSLLAAADEPDNIIEDNSLDLGKTLADETPLDRRFGSYSIISEIGRGGMGTVFLAERDDGEFLQRVALKIVRQSIADSEMVDRFRRERQILASLNHPNIAILLDGGVNEAGEPFIAMEYIAGEPLTDYVMRPGRTVTEDLELFVKVLDAVSYAHGNLVVHRDIKPSNILVTPGGEPKLLDFGLAKLIDPDSMPEETRLQAFTPAYASPEQILGKGNTTSSDVYSLGIVLFEILTGTKPFEFEGRSLEQIIETITIVEPPLPSKVIADGPGRTGFGTDLDTITLTALRKEPERRYASVEAFAGDIRRFIDGRPISARPNTFGYRAGKFLSRNKLAVTAAAIVLVAIVAGLSVALWKGAEARRESARSAAISRFLQGTLLGAFPESSVQGRKGAQATVVDMLNESSRRIESGELDQEPDVKAELRRVIGSGFFTLGLYPEARTMLEKAFDEQSRLYGTGGSDTLLIELDLATLYAGTAEYERSMEIFERRIPDARAEYKSGRLEPVVLTNKLNDYAIVARATGKTRIAEDALREGLDIATTHGIDGQIVSLTTFLSLLYLDQGRFDEAESTQSDVVTRSRLLPENDSAPLAPALTLLGSIKMEKGKLDEAKADLTEGEAIYRKFFGPEHTPIADNLRLQAQVDYLEGNYAAAREKIDTVLANYQRTSNPKYVSFATALTVRGLTLNKLGATVDAEQALHQALKLRTENLPPGHFMTSLTKGALGEVLLDQNKLAEAAVYLRESLSELSASQVADNLRVALARERVARLDAKLAK